MSVPVWVGSKHTHRQRTLPFQWKCYTHPNPPKIQKTQISWYRFKWIPNLNLNLYCEIPRNRSFSILGMKYFQWKLSYIPSILKNMRREARPICICICSIKSCQSHELHAGLLVLGAVPQSGSEGLSGGLRSQTHTHLSIRPPKYLEECEMESTLNMHIFFSELWVSRTACSAGSRVFGVVRRSGLRSILKNIRREAASTWITAATCRCVWRTSLFIHCGIFYVWCKSFLRIMQVSLNNEICHFYMLYRSL